MNLKWDEGVKQNNLASYDNEHSGPINGRKFVDQLSD
jgi:hypothetical protein